MFSAAELLAMAGESSTPTDQEGEATAPTGGEAEVPPVEGEEVQEEGAAVAPEVPPIPSTKLGWGASLKALEDAGQGELAAHAKRIQADATRKAQEASASMRAAEALMAEAKRLIAQSSKPPAEAGVPAPAAEETVDPWDAASLKRMAQAEARRLLEEELAPIRAEREAQLRAAEVAQREAQLDAFLAQHPDFDEAMQTEAANLIVKAQEAGRFVALEDAYTVAKARRMTAEAERLKTEAEAAKLKAAQMAKAKQAAVGKAAPSAATGAVGTTQQRPPTTAADYLRLARG